MYYIIALFLSLLKISLSNVWDNIYTQANSPHYVIADNFEIKLLNIEENITAGEILVSSELGLMKLSLINNPITRIENYRKLIVYYFYLIHIKKFSCFYFEIETTIII